MRLSRLPVLLVAAVVAGAGAGCAATIEGSGSPADGLLAEPSASTRGPSASGFPNSTGSPTDTATPPSPTPTVDPVLVKQRLLCVLERASITSINTQFNKSKDRDAQIRVLRAGAITIRGHLDRSGLPRSDRVRRAGQSVLDQLDRLVQDASAGGSPSTSPYNVSTQRFQETCSTLS